MKLIHLTRCSLGEEIEEDLDCVREFQVFGYYGETGRRGEGVDGNILIVWRREGIGMRGGECDRLMLCRTGYKCVARRCD